MQRSIKNCKFYHADNSYNTCDVVLFAIESICKTQRKFDRVWANPTKSEQKKIIKKIYEIYQADFGANLNYFLAQNHLFDFNNLLKYSLTIWHK